MNNLNNKLRVLVIGGGSIGKRHIKNLQSLGISNITVLKRVYDQAFADEQKVSVITSLPKDNKGHYDCMFICSPTALHIAPLEYAIEHGIHVFMEKPLTHDAASLNAAKKLLNKKDIVFFIGFMLRFHPLVKKIKEIIDGNELGEVYSARFEFGSFLPYWHPWEDYKTSYASRKKLGGGVINTITHELDLIQYYFGNPKSIYCQSTNFDKLQIEVEEQCEAVFEYNNKVVTLHLDYLQKDYDRNIKILFENGKITWDWHDNMINITKHKSQKTSIPLENFDVNDLYVNELKEFLQLLNTNTISHQLDFKHAIANTEIMLGMHHSNELSRKIKMEEVLTLIES